jgi:hypothetical protein
MEKSEGFNGDGGRGPGGGEAGWADEEDDEDGEEARGGDAEGERFMLSRASRKIDDAGSATKKPRNRLECRAGWPTNTTIIDTVGLIGIISWTLVPITWPAKPHPGPVRAGDTVADASDGRKETTRLFHGVSFPSRCVGRGQLGGLFH